MPPNSAQAVLNFFAPDVAGDRAAPFVANELDSALRSLLGGVPIDSFVRNPSAETFGSLVSLNLSNASPAVLASTLRQYADRIWLERRASQLGIPNPDALPPRIFFRTNGETGFNTLPQSVLIDPAPADRAHVAYRAHEVRSILSLLKIEQAVVAFTAMNPDIRLFVLPQLGSLFDEARVPFVYMKLEPGNVLERPSGEKFVDAYTNLDKLVNANTGHHDSSMEIRALPLEALFKRFSAGSVLILDVLDFAYLTTESPSHRIKPYEELLQVINRDFIRGKEGRLIVLMNGTPSTFERRWQSFLPFTKEMGLGEFDRFAVGLNPQFMNTDQAAAFLGIGLPEARLLERYVPLLPAVLEHFKYGIQTLDIPIGRLIAEFAKLSAGKELFVTQMGEVKRANARESKFAPGTIHPSVGVSHYRLGGSGTVAQVDYIEKKTARARAPGRGNSNTGKKQGEIWLQGSMGLFNRSPILRGILPGNYRTPEKLVEKLVELRPAIILEQRKVRGVDEERLDDYSLTTLVKAVAVGRGFVDEVQSYERLAGARDRFDRSPTLQSISREVSSDDETLVRFLLEHRDRIAVENLHAAGKLAPAEFTFEAAEDHYSLGTLIDALEAGRLISKAQAHRLQRKVMSPLEYFLARRDVVTPDVKRAMGVRFFMPVIDRAHFGQIKNPDKPLSDYNIRQAVGWGRWFLQDPDVAVRSIYTGAEIAFITLFSNRNIAESVPGNVAARLEAAGNRAVADPAGARREAVTLLGEMLGYYDSFGNAGETLSGFVKEGLRQIRRLYEWNEDALASDSGRRVSTVAGLATVAEVSGGATRRTRTAAHPDRAIRAASRVHNPVRGAQSGIARPVIVPAVVRAPIIAR